MSVPSWLRSKPFNRLGFRLGAMLSLAMLPLGAIAFYQTHQIALEAQENATAALQGLTTAAAGAERELIQTGLGASEALAAVIADYDGTQAQCSAIMRRYIDKSEVFIFAGFIDNSGNMACASAGDGTDFSETELFRDMMSNPRQEIEVNRRGVVTGQSVVIISSPVYRDAELRGFVSISLPHFVLKRQDITEDERLINVVTFNSEGTVISSTSGAPPKPENLPADVNLSNFVGGDPTNFAGRSNSGQQRLYSIVPIVPDKVYALGIWAPRQAFLNSWLVRSQTFVFPLLMWIVSLLVAYFAVHRLVLRHMMRLQARMRAVGRGLRRMKSYEMPDAPEEMREMGLTLQKMVETIATQEESLKYQLQEKNVLLREVHHRVKNNLQLISSIINMQIRKSWSPEARFALKRIQDRVLGLATIHRQLYQTEMLSSVPAGSLVRELTNQLVELGTEASGRMTVEFDLDEVILYPDQAVPLALLTSEAVTNALKHVGQNLPEKPRLHVSLKASDSTAVLTITNTRNAARPHDLPEDPGLGTQLINAFAGQLEGEVDVSESDVQYQLKVSFPIADFVAEEMLEGTG